ncbi:hypothetical protein [Methyloversatilis sp. XJ19-49]|jgi:hypothetical protein|uniref:hypothetical protein n=1 Tax=Methyloversatilis sp. XJ19-49 TaxID=2963429 RepID=UPI00211C6191|nr:hypothetical protein [Methyloversatilis sp. XJ19-49]MCQ9377750.1 hypothetical protein [Methyloversatilis sp. XJ19-49]
MLYIDFNITQSSIDNGRLYLDAAHRSFFPEDCLGGRGTTEHAHGAVAIEANGELFETDIRVNTSRISPRKSFKSWLKSVGAVTGKTVRLHKLAERHFKLEYLG